MANKARNTSGKFAPKSEVPRKVRSVNLTDTAWQWLADVAAQSGVSRNDYLEAMAEGGIPFMEMVSSKISPLMETVETEKKVGSANTAKQPDSEIYPLIEMVEVASDSHKEEDAGAEYNALLESSTHITNKLREEVAKLRSQLEAEHGDREEIEVELADLAQLKKQVKEHVAELHREERCLEFEKARWQQELSDARCELADAKATILNQSNKIRELERGYSFKPNPAESRLRLEIGNLQAELAELKQKSVPAWDFPEAADLLNQLKAKRKKSTVTLADVEFLLELLEG